MCEYGIEITPKGIKKSFGKQREQIHDLFHKFFQIQYIVLSEIKTRIFDKTLGVFWLFLEPIIMTMLYYVLTVIIFHAMGETHHFLFIMVSIIFWRWFSRTIDISPNIINSYGSVLRQINFSPFLVILIFMGQEIVYLGIGLVVIIIFLACYNIYPSIYFCYLPIVLITQFTFMFWLTLVFCTIGTLWKDLSGFLYAFTSIWWYLSPGIYPISKIPGKYLKIYMLNPFAHILPAYRDILIYCKAPSLIPLFWIFSISLLLSFLSLIVFNKIKYYLYVYL